MNIKKSKSTDSSEVSVSSSQIILNFCDQNLNTSENEVRIPEDEAEFDRIQIQDIKGEIAVWAERCDFLKFEKQKDKKFSILFVS